MASNPFPRQQAQQGDVLFQRVEAIPERRGARPRPRPDRILAKGETTGHAHRLTEASDGLLVEVDGVLYMQVGPGGAEVVHDEHKPIAFAGPSVWAIDIVREYDHFAATRPDADLGENAFIRRIAD
ncbi:MAG: hypothetical protein HY719_06225 [Planctomycetes bacterium]|nr:hypothetical protein [Planctomycetota bacterium]